MPICTVMLVVLLFVALLGLAVGSFLNVVIWRLPRGENLSHPGSHCGSCGAPVSPRDNIPVVSWLLLRGTCRSCGARISPRYLAVEVLTAVLWVTVVAVFYDDARQAALGLALVTMLVPLTFIDLEHQVLPNVILAPFAVLALVLGLTFDPSYVPEQLVAGAAALAFFLVPALLRPGGMGMGDVKLAGVLGLYLGRAVAPAILFALMVGVLVGVVVIQRLGRERGRKTKVPFGPSLAAGAVAALLVGHELVDRYLDTF